MNHQRHRLAAVAVAKSFAGVPALRHADFVVESGEIHGLVGVNGAGKSTLMKIFGGVFEEYEGIVEIDGGELRLTEPERALEAGIEVVYQEVDAALVAELTVAENVLLDLQAGRSAKRWIRWRSFFEHARDVLRRVDPTIDPRATVQDLPPHDRQKVLIARALAGKRRFLLFDEPTATLGPRESEQLFALLRELRSAGLGIAYISHRLHEVAAICDRVTVMRDGRTIATLAPSDVAGGKVVELMLGHQRKRRAVSRQRAPADRPPALEARDLWFGDRVRNVSLSIAPGEVVGVAGLVGAGKTELASLLFGGEQPDAGEIYVDERPVRFRTPRDAVRAGIALVPEERRKQGLILDWPLAQNLSLAVLSTVCHGPFVVKRKEDRLANELIEMLDIKALSPHMEVQLLSGGNQQKAVIGGWLRSSSRVYVLDEPTKGVDVGAKDEIYALIRRLADDGAAVLLLSSELEEIVDNSDRILVMYDGQLTAEFRDVDASMTDVLVHATGGRAGGPLDVTTAAGSN